MFRASLVQGAVVWLVKGSWVRVPDMIAVRLLPVLAVLLLPACGSGEQAAEPLAERDPAVTAALADPLMADPDLTSQNRGNAALTGGGPAAGEIPPPKRGQAERDAARAAALTLAGGALRAAPLATRTLETSPADALTAAGLVRALPWGRSCADKLGYTASWAAKMPLSLQVYPRGAIQEAAGSDLAGCKVRAVQFKTPAPPGEVVDFYATLAGKGGYALQAGKAGADLMLTGAMGGGQFALFARTGAGVTEVYLVSKTG